MKVNIEKYNPYWVNLFAKESNNIKRIQTIIHFKNIGDNNDTYKRVL